ncbi:trypsin-like serine peptidase [Thermocatellispora tengchongensis]|uniref:trypsin-like serine peptidase n=1 Tax=Thermocatellispora tengchongensis TaxID=1073253 RepID=UPI003625327E
MHRRLALVSAVALALAGALVPTGAARAVTGPEPVGWSATDSWPERRSVLQYWTPRRMLAAQPMGAPAPRRNSGSSAPTQGTPWATRGVSAAGTQGTPWTVRPASTGGRLARVPNSPGLRWDDGGTVVRTTGRVFFTTADGRNSSCSGTAVTSANESVVMTAGHCVKLNGAFHRNWVFVPAFDDGRRPFGTWVATWLMTTPQWNAREDINFDVAAAVVAPLDGRTLTDAVGGQGWRSTSPGGGRCTPSATRPPRRSTART